MTRVPFWPASNVRSLHAILSHAGIKTSEFMQWHVMHMYVARPVGSELKEVKCQIKLPKSGMMVILQHPMIDVHAFVLLERPRSEFIPVHPPGRVGPPEGNAARFAPVTLGGHDQSCTQTISETVPAANFPANLT